MSPHRQVITLDDIPVFVFNGQSRCFGLITELGDYFFTETGRFIRFFFVSLSFDQIFRTDPTTEFSNDQRIERVPFAKQIVLLDFLPVFHKQFRTVRNIMRNQDNIGILIDNPQFSQTADNDITFLTVILCIFYRTQFLEFYDTVVFRFQRVLGRDVTCRTTHVECTQGQLCTRFTDRLCSNGTDSFTHLYQLTGSQVTSVAFRTYPFLRFASQYRTYFYTFDR